MYLKAIEVNGFKSFSDKIKLDFKKGITSIVGPNGSGKSNILDAILWVLGEQSHKSIRAKEGTDVIFSGGKINILIALNKENIPSLIILTTLFPVVTNIFIAVVTRFDINPDKKPSLNAIATSFHFAWIFKAIFLSLSFRTIKNLSSSNPLENPFL